MSVIDAAKLHSIGQWSTIIPGITGVDPPEKQGPCVRCGGDTRWARHNDYDETGGTICHHCGQAESTADGVGTIAFILGISQSEAAQKVLNHLGIDLERKTVPVDVITRVCNAKRMPRESFLQYGAKPDIRISQKTGKPFEVARVPVFDVSGNQVSYFDCVDFHTGFAKKDGEHGLFLPGRTPQSGESWLLVEGVKDAAALHGLGFNAAGVCTNKMAFQFAEAFRGCDVTIVPDLDIPGQEGADITAGNLFGIARSIRVARLPGTVKEKKGDDVRDILKGQHGEHLVRHAIESAAEWKSKPQAQITNPKNSQDNIRPVPPGTIVKALDRGNFGTALEDCGDTVLVEFVGEDGTSVKTINKKLLAFQNGAPIIGERRPISLIDSKTFAGSDYSQRFLIRGILVEGQPAIVGGRSKVMKTSVMVDAAISLGTGTDFLGQFPVEQKTVAILSGESGQFTLQETAKRICYAKSRKLGREVELKSANVFWGFSLPQISVDSDLEQLAELIVENKIDVVIVDPAYLCLLGGELKIQAANVLDMGPLLLKLSNLGRDTNSTIALCHHARKSGPEPFAPMDLEELSMSGFAEWARQWLLLSRREAYQEGSGEHRLWMRVGGSAGHSGLFAVDIDEGQLADDFTGRRWEVSIACGTEARQKAVQDKEQRRRAQKNERTQADAKEIIPYLEKNPEGKTKNQIREFFGWNTPRTTEAIDFCIEENLVEPCEIQKNNQIYRGFRCHSDALGRTRTNIDLSGCPGGSDGQSRTRADWTSNKTSPSDCPATVRVGQGPDRNGHPDEKSICPGGTLFSGSLSSCESEKIPEEDTEGVWL